MAFKIIVGVATLYFFVCLLLFLFQEKLIFFPEKLKKDFKFNFSGNSREINIQADDGKMLNGRLFNASNSRGLIFYLHGNAGSLNSWGDVAVTYTEMQYDVFILDYRGYGKSEGSISSESQMFNDVQVAYNEMKKLYPEERIIVLGYSIGTGPAAKLASANKPRLLILQSPYYSLVDMMKRSYPVVPTFILKYKFHTDTYIRHCTMPVIIFHGDQDAVIHYNSSIRLKKLMKKTDQLIILNGQGHNGMTDNPQYRKDMRKILRWPLEDL